MHGHWSERLPFYERQDGKDGHVRLVITYMREDVTIVAGEDERVARPATWVPAHPPLWFRGASATAKTSSSNVAVSCTRVVQHPRSPKPTLQRTRETPTKRSRAPFSPHPVRAKTLFRTIGEWADTGTSSARLAAQETGPSTSAPCSGVEHAAKWVEGPRRRDRHPPPTSGNGLGRHLHVAGG